MPDTRTNRPAVAVPDVSTAPTSPDVLPAPVAAEDDLADLMLAFRSFQMHHARVLAREGAARGLNATDTRFVLFLAATGTGVTPKQAGEHLELSTGAMTSLIDRLERHGHLRRGAEPGRPPEPPAPPHRVRFGRRAADHRRLLRRSPGGRRPRRPRPPGHAVHAAGRSAGPALPSRQPLTPVRRTVGSMTTPAELLVEAFSRVPETVGRAVDGLSEDQLASRPAAGANTLAWLAWHIARGQDSQIADLADSEQVWTADGWVERFGLPFPAEALGYGMSRDDVGRVRASAELLNGYLAAVHERTVAYLHTLSADDFETVVDEAWDPPVTVGVRLVSILDDCVQHAGQAGYARGVLFFNR